MSEFIHDPYTRKAMELVRQGKSFFITGKAGTGKTYLLNEIVSVLRTEGWKISVIAPTGVAAKNAGGSTIHSFLNLKPLTYIPGAKIRGYGYKLDFDLERLNAIQELDIMIIDEISMVRCDLLDCIDDQLRHYRNSKLPFGGVQILFFGDFYQLPPVLEDDKTEAEMINGYYDSVYAFHSDVWKSCHFPMLELMTNHRQDGDTTFFNILNKIRVKEESDADLRLLNQKVEKGVLMSSSDNQIKLTSLNRTADNTNKAVLHELRGTERELPAYIKYYKYGVQTYIDDSEWDGYKLSKDEYPTDRVLKLKVGAKVMFLRNESGLYSNGTIGIVKKIEQDTISIRTEDNRNVSVGRSTWYFYHDIWDKRNKTYEQYLFATFEQFPLRLAWAVTIHKSQGLTFNKVMIDIRNAFAHGQTYVALSRCKTLGGITLNKEIHHDDIIIDEVVDEFMSSVERIPVISTPTNVVTEANFSKTKMYDVMGYKTRSFMVQQLHSGNSLLQALDILKLKKFSAWNNSMSQFKRKYPNSSVDEFMPGYVQVNSLTASHYLKLTDNGTSIESCNKNIEGVLFIPDNVDFIYSNAFKGCNNLTEIFFNDKLISIRDNAFRDCTSLSKVNFGKRLEKIGTSTFFHTGLTDVKLPDSLKELGSDAFANTKIWYPTLPQNLETCGPNIFDSSVHVSYLNNHFTAENGVLYNKDKSEIIFYPKNKTDSKFTIPNSVKRICWAAFFYAKFEEIELPQCLEMIDDYAFQYCSNLGKIILPVKTTKLGKSIFANCDKLTQITLGTSLYSSDFDDMAFDAFDRSKCTVYVYGCDYKEYDENAMFDEFSSIEIIPGTEIDEDDYSYEDDDYLTLSDDGTKVISCDKNAEGIIEIPEGVTTIEDYAFKNITGITGISFPESLEFIGESAFYGCSGITEIELPDGLLSIGTEAFLECSLSYVFIPYSVEEIGVTPFACEIEVDEDNDIYCSENGVLFDSAMNTLYLYPRDFEEYKYDVPSSVKKIASYAFECAQLDEITLPQGLEEICSHAFCNSDIKDLLIPSSVYKIGENIITPYSGYGVTLEITDFDMVKIDDEAFANVENNGNTLYVVAQQLEKVKRTRWARCFDWIEAIKEPIKYGISIDSFLAAIESIPSVKFGSTTVEQAQRNGLNIKWDTSKHCYSGDYAGIRFYGYTLNGLIDTIIIFHHSTPPKSIIENGFNTSQSFVYWLDFLTNHKFNVKIKNGPSIKNIQDRKVLSGEIEATTQDKRIEVNVVFTAGNKNGEGYENTSMNSLYCIEIKLISDDSK